MILVSETREDLTLECVLLSLSNIVIHHQNDHDITNITKLPTFTLNIRKLFIVTIKNMFALKY